MWYRRPQIPKPNKCLASNFTNIYGPKCSKVIDLIDLKKKGLSESLIITKVKNTREKYKNFTVDEIFKLKESDVSDRLVGSLLD